MELYIVRHGKTLWNREELVQGSSDVELLPEGIEMARQTGEGLKDVHFDAIYSSPLSRAVRTAELIRGDRNLEINIDDRIMEMGFGVCEGKKFVPGEENGGILKGFWDSPGTYEAPEGGEDFYRLRARAADFLKYVGEHHGDNERILVVAHAALNQALFSELDDLDIKDFWRHGKQLNCAVTIAVRENGKWHIAERNKIYY